MLASVREVPLRVLALDEQRWHKMHGEGSQGAGSGPRTSLRGCPKDVHGLTQVNPNPGRGREMYKR